MSRFVFGFEWDWEQIQALRFERKTHGHAQRNLLSGIGYCIDKIVFEPPTGPALRIPARIPDTPPPPPQT